MLRVCAAVGGSGSVVLQRGQVAGKKALSAKQLAAGRSLAAAMSGQVGAAPPPSPFGQQDPAPSRSNPFAALAPAASPRPRRARRGLAAVGSMKSISFLNDFAFWPRG